MGALRGQSRPTLLGDDMGKIRVLLTNEWGGRPYWLTPDTGRSADYRAAATYDDEGTALAAARPIVEREGWTATVVRAGTTMVPADDGPRVVTTVETPVEGIAVVVDRGGVVAMAARLEGARPECWNEAVRRASNAGWAVDEVELTTAGELVHQLMTEDWPPTRGATPSQPHEDDGDLGSEE